MLFSRIDEKKMMEEVQAEIEAAKKAAEAAAKAAEKPEKPDGIAQIGIEDFMGVELRTAQILEAERVPKAKKLIFSISIFFAYEKKSLRKEALSYSSIAFLVIFTAKPYP